MRFFLSLGVASLLTGQILAQGPYAITGVRNKNLSLRRNIDDLQKEAGPQWDLYIQAFSAMQKADSDDPLSHFQIGGIHGQPFIEWNNTGKEITGSDWRGYCPHGEGLFLSWHRPYVLLFEQALVSQARSIAQTYPDSLRAVYAQAAEELRSPWWDYAISSGVPSATVPQQVSVNTATGRKQVENPLAGFTFPSLATESGKYGTFGTDSKIRRCSRARMNYPQTANGMIGAFNYRQDVYDVFVTNSLFSEFGSTANPGLSLEQIHNYIHRTAACGEQFNTAEYAGFDPLFMLHHTNIDRLWAYWQAIRPEEGNMRETYAGGARFTTPVNTRVSIDSPLQPFFQNSASFHTSKSVSAIQNLGYKYETLDFGQKSASVMKRDATLLINKLYSKNDRPASSRRDRKARRDVGQEKRFFVNVQVDLEELPRPCSLSVYIEKEVVGTMIAMPQPQTGVSNARLSLDNYVSSEKGAVEQIFAGNVTGTFQVAITKPDGSLVKTGPIASLNMELEDVFVMPTARKDEFPTYKTHRRTKIEDISEFSP